LRDGGRGIFDQPERNEFFNRLFIGHDFLEKGLQPYRIGLWPDPSKWIILPLSTTFYPVEMRKRKFSMMRKITSNFLTSLDQCDWCLF
jgi:hypothetical protein